MTDFAALYRVHVADLSALAGDLSDEQLATTVPGSPLWTVKEVLCHCAGGASDGLTGRTDGAPGAGWTARHVAERADLPVGEIVGELQANVDAAAATLVDNPFPALVYDIAVHHADIHEALGMHRLGDDLWQPVLDAVSGRVDPSVLESTSAYEVFRGVFSRRSRAQIQGWDTSLTAEQLDAMCIFGPREDDQPVPA